MPVPPTDPAAPASAEPAAGPIGHLHHVGHVVSDMNAAIALYRRLGFRLPPPTYPALPPEEGAPPRAFGAGNTRAMFSRDFVEVVTVVADGAPAGEESRIVPLQAPAEALPQLAEGITQTAARLAAALDRFEGLHILVFQTPDADAAAARLAAGGIDHGGVHRLQRPVETENGTLMVRAGFLEIDGGSARVPEGRLAVAENPSPEEARHLRSPEHPNGATDLVGVVLCVPDAELATYERRYLTYLHRRARDEGPARVFDLHDSRVVLVTESGMEAILPGERPAAVPAFVAYVVAVGDPAATRRHLEGNGFPVRETGSGDLFVPAMNALGVAVVFRPAG